MEKSWWRNNRGAGVFSGCAFLALFMAAVPARSGSYVGGQAGGYLRSPAGAAAFSLGGANSASPEYLNAWWNPATLAGDKERRLTVGSGYRVLGRVDGLVSLESRLPPRMGIGLVLLYRGDPWLNNLRDDQEEKLPNGSYTTLTAKVGLGYLALRNLVLGANLGLYYQSMPAYYDGSNESSFSIGGLDLAARYRVNDRLELSLLVRDISLVMDWQFASQWQFDSLGSNAVPPSLVFAGKYRTTLLGKPFIWTCDLKGLRPLVAEKTHRTVLNVNNGFEWQRWNTLFLRAGIADLSFDTDILDNRQNYQDHFSLSITAGCMLDLTQVHRGLKINYGVASNKAWAGIDQQIDAVFAF